MTLTNYWWLLIWLVFSGMLLEVKFQKQPISVLGKIEYRWNWEAVCILACPYAIWSMNRSWFGDTETYRRTFLNAPSSLLELPQYLIENTKDRGFSVLVVFVKMIIGNNDKLFFLLVAIFQIFCVTYFFRRYSSRFLLCMFMFVASTDYLSWMFNGMRQFIAVSVVLFCFGFVLQKRYIPAILIVLLAATIHGTALLMLPIIFIIQGKAWNKKTLAMIAVVLVAMFFIGRFTTVLNSVLADTQYNDILTNEIWLNDDGTHIIRVLFYSIPAILSLIGKQHVDAANDPVINLCVNCAIVTASLYLLANVSSGIYVGRLPIYTTFPGYVACAWLLDNVFTENSIQLAQIGLVLGYLVFFYYQMHVTWGLV